MISFVVPAHDEEQLLGRTLDAITRSMAALEEEHEVIVVDDASTDATSRIAREKGARVVAVQHRQISATRNSGARMAGGEVLVFVDADTCVNAEVLRAARVALSEGAIGGGCLVAFDGRLPLYARLLQRIVARTQRSARFAAGCFLFCTREAFESTGGFDEAMFSGEEVEFSRALKAHGSFVLLGERVLTSGRKLRAYSGWEILRILVGLGLRGRRGVTSRDRLDAWYGPRRRDPEPPEESEGST